MKVAVLRETAPGERRVAVVPDTVSKLAKMGLEFIVERGAGAAASYADGDYEKGGAKIAADARSAVSEADLVVKVQRPSPEEVDLLRPGSALVSFLPPVQAVHVAAKLAERNITAFSMDLVPRISRAQNLDALSSMSTLAGYKAVILAAEALPKIFPMIVSAAGTLTPARVFVIGAGVAGLQAIATARRLGAVVRAFDVRAATKEQVESLGATFVEMNLKGEKTEEASGYAKQLSEDSQARALQAIARQVRDADVVICTALIPGKPAPRLVTREMVATMKAGAVLVDLAAEMGGNCELTVPGQTVKEKGVTIMGPLNLPASLPAHASQMFSRNIAALLTLIVKDGALRLDFEDPIVRDMCVTHASEIRHEGVRKLLEAGSVAGQAGS